MRAARCSYQAGMFADEPAEWFYDGPLARTRGGMARICHHESGHAVLKYALGLRQGALSVSTHYHRGPGGVVIASHSGLCDGWFAPGEIRRPVPPKESIPVRIDESNFFACWKLFLRPAMINVAGHAAERKYCRANGLPFAANSTSDRDNAEREARRTWACAGRNGEAMLRLVWRETQRMLDDPMVWKAVQVIEAALFSGILWREPADPRPGDRVEFVIDGEQVEAIIQGTGLRFGQFWQEHRCGPECVRSRPISRAFRKTIQAWAAESISTPKLKELENAC
jgi:hypothetical protein